MYAIVLYIWIQTAQSLTPYIDRFEFVKDAEGKTKPIATLAQCKKIVTDYNHYRPAETDPNKEYVWQEAECKKLR